MTEGRWLVVAILIPFVAFLVVALITRNPPWSCVTSIAFALATRIGLASRLP